MGERPAITPWPWILMDYTKERPEGGYLRIEGPNGEKIADIFPFAGHNGVGLKVARGNAALIMKAVRDHLSAIGQILDA